MIFNIASFAQESAYSLQQFALPNQLPSEPARDNQGSIAFLNRQTQIVSGLSVQSNFLSAELPFLNKKSGKRYGGIGMNFIHKSASTAGLLETSSIAISLAYNLQLGKKHNINFGLQPVFASKRTSIEKITTGSQWLANEFRFDPSTDIGESILKNNQNYFNINAGLEWMWLDHQHEQPRLFASLSAFNLNRPADDFLINSPSLPISIIGRLGVLILSGQKIDLLGQVLHNRFGTIPSTNGILSAKIRFRNSNPYDLVGPGAIELTLRNNFRSQLSAGMILHQPNFSLGFSYGFLISSNRTEYFNHDLEFGAMLTKAFGDRKKKPIAIVKAAGVRRFDFQQAQQHSKSVEDIQSVQREINGVGKVASVRFELQKNFNFKFGDIELDDEGKKYLDGIADFLSRNPLYKIEIIGHTDDIGKSAVNFKLSEARAKSVLNYIASRGISIERIKSTGRGDREPVVPNQSEENRAKNRRVQFILYIDQQ